ncbi:MAG: winged helix-turn-helix domain-containing protein [Porphyromonadaceae bacterium]|nr:winged helix-turn-helix domain-containing protein [Porphyromonadaceae bacterium]
MKVKIGVNAGLVWNALLVGNLDIKALKKATKLNERDVYAALGWLAREDKIYFVETENELVVGLT